MGVGLPPPKLISGVFRMELFLLIQVYIFVAHFIKPPKPAIMTVEARKYQLINTITRIQDNTKLEEVESAINEILDEGNLALKKIAVPMRKKLDIEELAMEQNYKAPSKKKMDKLIRELDITEPIEELLKMAR